MFVFVICLFGLLCAIALANINFINRWGRNSILVYLIHPFLVDIIKIIVNRVHVINVNHIFIIFVICAIIITDILSREFLKKLHDTALNKFSKLIKLGE